MSTVAETTEGERTLRDLVPALKGVRNMIHPHRTAAPSSVFSDSKGRASHKGTAYYEKMFLSYQRVD